MKLGIIHGKINHSCINNKKEEIKSNSGRENGREGFHLLGPRSKPAAPRRRHLNATMLRVGAVLADPWVILTA